MHRIRVPGHLGVELSDPGTSEPRRPTTVDHRGLFPDVSAQAGDVQKNPPSLQNTLQSIPTMMPKILGLPPTEEDTARDASSPAKATRATARVDDERRHKLFGQEGRNGRRYLQTVLSTLHQNGLVKNLPVMAQQRARQQPYQALHSAHLSLQQ